MADPIADDIVYRNGSHASIEAEGLEPTLQFGWEVLGPDMRRLCQLHLRYVPLERATGSGPDHRWSTWRCQVERVRVPVPDIAPE